MLNHIEIMGRLTRDPELRRTGGGIAVASFTVAVDRDYKAGDGEKKTDFFNCVAWRQTGEFVSKYFKKGSMIVAAGRMEMREWTDREGAKRISWEMNVENAYFGEGKKEGPARDAGMSGGLPRRGDAPPRNDGISVEGPEEVKGPYDETLEYIGSLMGR